MSSCPKGYIQKKGYERKSHSRKAYSRNGTIVKSAHVSRTKVGPSCTPDKGKPGKTPERAKVLPAPGKEISLSRMGYATSKKKLSRHRALSSASSKYDPLKVLKRLVLLSNYQADPTAKKTMKADVEYMKGVYSKYKKLSRQLSKKGSKKGSRKGSKKGSRKGSKKRAN